MCLCLPPLVGKWTEAREANPNRCQLQARPSWISTAKVAEPYRGNAFDVPNDSGVLLSLTSGACHIKVVKDAHVKHLHPHVHVPASLHDSLHEQGGGGSGVPVMRAADPYFGDIVLKHGGHEDTEELFALATIEKELKLRGEAAGSIEAAMDLVMRTPDFKYIYISQAHLELQTSNSVIRRPSCCSHNGEEGQCLRPPVKGIRVCDLAYWQQNRSQQMTKVNIVDDVLEVYLDTHAAVDDIDDIQCSAAGEGYSFLQNFMHSFIPLQKSHRWKVTLAQKAVGHVASQTGSSFLTQGALNKVRLRTLMDEMIKVIHNLVILTSPAEREIIHDVKKQLESISDSSVCNPSQVSNLSDLYVGRAIKKNFHPETGRFPYLRRIGALFRAQVFDLTEAETLPAQKLGVLLDRDVGLEKVFGEVAGPTALDTYSDAWVDLLVCATSLHGINATTSVWTGGVTDGGLHNLFLDKDYVWLFDMGEPALMSLPALLTKFLFSFLHTMGMEDIRGDGKWVNRFVPCDNLHLTNETKVLLPEACETFSAALNCLVLELFQGEQSVRKLLFDYVVLQLLSDCAFCIAQWETKAGAIESREKWLWRALWDMYIASDVANGLVR